MFSIGGRVASDNTFLKNDLHARQAKLNIGHFNGQSINALERPEKLDEIKSILSGGFLDVVGVSETWLKPSTNDGIVGISGYKLIRNDRVNRRGGGVACYVSTKLKAKIIDSSPENSVTEYLFIEISFNNIKTAIGIIYRPDGNINTELTEVLSEISSRYVNVFIMGDFNVDLMENSTLNNTSAFFQNFHLEIATNGQPTHFDTFHQSLSLIDFFVVSRSAIIDFSEQFWVPSISKHAFIYISISIPTNKSKPTFHYRDFKNVNIAGLLAACDAVDMTPFYNSSNINFLANFLNDVVNNLFNRFVPLKVHTPKKASCPWINPELRHAIALRDLAFRVFSRDSSHANWNTFKMYRNRVTYLNKKAKTKFGRECFNAISNSQAFWAQAKKLGISEDKDEPIHLDPNDLNTAFASLHETGGASPRIDEDIPESYNSFSFRNVMLDEFVNAIIKLKSNAVGMDGMSLKFIKLIQPSFCRHFLHLCNFTLSSSSFPQCWKVARITPIPKVGNPKTVSDFRPISILPALSKACELLMKNQIDEFLALDNRTNIFSNQSGFRANHSTSTAILGVTERIRENMNNKLLSLLLLLDFSKAFNKINISILCKKLKEQFHFSSSACNLIYSYMSDRLQCVGIDGKFSDFLPTFSGVPQGSILGPLLFLLYINDLPTVVTNSQVFIFADDVQLLLGVDIAMADSGVALLREDFASVLEWTRVNKLVLNTSKTQALPIYNRPMGSNLPHIVHNGVQIQFVTAVKSLGVWITHSLSWDKHISHICRKVFLILKNLYSLKHFLPVDTRIKLVKALILPHFIYCCEIFNGCSVASKHRLRVCFNSAVRFIFSVQSRDHISHLVPRVIGTNLDTYLNYRSLVLLFKVIQNQGPSYLYEKITFGRSARTRTIIIPQFTSRVMDQSFIVRAARLWNNLPMPIKTCQSIKKFKLQTEEFMFTVA